MKKTILIILAVLPIVLLVVISIAGWILEQAKYNPVETVEFVNTADQPYGSEHEFKVAQGKTRETKIRFEPADATNPKFTYSSKDNTICTVDENGVITGHHWGTTIVTVKSENGITCDLNVTVTADTPFAVYLTPETVSLKVTQTHTLKVEVDAPVSLDRSVTYQSDNPDIVSVDVNGKITARGVGTATITVTTVLGEKTDTCVVTVLDGNPPIYFNVENDPDIVKNSSDIYVCSRNVIDIMSMLVLEEGIDPDSVAIEIIGGKDRATLEGGVLTLNKRGTVTVRISALYQTGEPLTADIKFGLKSN